MLFENAQDDNRLISINSISILKKDYDIFDEIKK